MADLVRKQQSQSEFDFMSEQVMDAELATTSGRIAPEKWEDLKEYLKSLSKRPELSSIEELSEITEKLVTAIKSGEPHFDLSQVTEFYCRNLNSGTLTEHPLSAYISGVFGKICFFYKTDQFRPQSKDLDEIQGKIESLNIIKSGVQKYFTEHDRKQALLTWIDSKVSDFTSFIEEHQNLDLSRKKPK